MQYSLLLVLAVALTMNLAAGSFFPTSCNQALTRYCGRTNCKIWYVDPINGRDNGNGSLALPWKNFSVALLQVKSRSVPAKSPYPPTQFIERNPNGVIQGGDVIVLRNGNHSGIRIQGYYNTLPITIVGEPGTRPVVDTFSLTSGANWSIKCLNITISAPDPGRSISSISADSYQGPAYSNVFAYNTVFSYPNLEFYRNKHQDYLYNASSTGFSTRDCKSLKIYGNYFYHVKRGIVVQSENTIVQRNVVNYFIGDGMRILHNNTLVEYNLVQNNMNVDNGTDHRDGLQMFTNGNWYNLYNITIRNNKFFAAVDKNRPFAAGFQGIVSFDVRVFNVTVQNNLVVTNTYYHGIALFKSQDCKIISNTIIDWTATRNPWITTDGGYSGNLIQNNIAHASSNTDGSTLVSNAFKKWTLTDFKGYFVDYANFNYRLKANSTSPFIGKGNSTLAPTIDLDGKLRSGAYDIGCYAFTPLTNPATLPDIFDPTFGDTDTPAEVDSDAEDSVTSSASNIAVLFALVQALFIVVLA